MKCLKCGEDYSQLVLPLHIKRCNGNSNQDIDIQKNNQIYIIEAELDQSDSQSVQGGNAYRITNESAISLLNKIKLEVSQGEFPLVIIKRENGSAINMEVCSQIYLAEEVIRFAGTYYQIYGAPIGYYMYDPDLQISE